jgi:ribosome-associated protein
MIFSELILESLKKEFQYFASRSSGPGGQNVNKVSSKIEIRYNIETSMVFTPEQKLLILAKLGNKITLGGELIVTSQEDRSQLKNKETATFRLIELLQKALTPRKSRKPTRPTRSSVEKRLDLKKQRSSIKQNRRFEEI